MVQDTRYVESLRVTTDYQQEVTQPVERDLECCFTYCKV